MSDEKTRKNELLIKPMPKDHPLFKRGFIIGGRIGSRSPGNTQVKGSQKQTPVKK